MTIRCWAIRDDRRAPSRSEIQTPGDIALACNGDLAFTSALDDRIRVVFGMNDGGPAPGNICD